MKAKNEEEFINDPFNRIGYSKEALKVIYAKGDTNTIDLYNKWIEYDDKETAEYWLNMSYEDIKKKANDAIELKNGHVLINVDNEYFNEKAEEEKETLK